MAWIVRLVKTEADGEKQSVDVATINRLMIWLRLPIWG